MNYKEQLRRFWKNEKNRMILKDAFLFGVSTLVFHFLYWHTNMNQWLFGPFTTEVFDFFTDITNKAVDAVSARHAALSQQAVQTLALFRMRKHRPDDGQHIPHLLSYGLVQPRTRELPVCSRLGHASLDVCCFVRALGDMDRVFCPS